MKLAIVRIRGDTRKTYTVSDTFNQLGLFKKNHCAIVEDTPRLKGMLKIIAPFATWGPIDEKTMELLKKKGDKVCALSPPRKGYGRKGVKVPFKMKGAYGNRAEKINDLLTRMM